MDQDSKSIPKTKHPFSGYSEIFRQIFESPRNAAMLCLGASAGLPIMLVYQVLSFWLREADVSRSTIGFFVWAGFAYSLKFLWAPLVDRIKIPGFSSWLGNRKGWTLFAILGTALAMFAMSQQNPSVDLVGVAVCAVLIAFASATLDICVDAWRVDNTPNAEQAMVSAIYQLGYRFGMIAAVTGGLFIADLTSFNITYFLLGTLAVIGGSTLLWAPDVRRPEKPEISPVLALALGLTTLIIISASLWFGLAENGWLRILIAWLGELKSKIPDRILWWTYILILASPFILCVWFLGPFSLRKSQSNKVYMIPILGDFADIVRRTGWWSLLVFAMVATYRISDTTMGVMTGPLYIDLGYDKSTIGTVKGAFGIFILIVGAFLGGLQAMRYGLARAMIVGAILTIMTNLAFAWLAQVDTPRAIYLFVTIGADNIAAGYAGSVFIAFMSIMTNKEMSATQYALMSSLFAFYGKSLAGFSGVLADAVGYELFFIITGLFGIPALCLAIWATIGKFTDGINDDGEPTWGPFALKGKS